MPDENRPPVDPSRVFFGGVLMLVGLGLLLDRTGWLDALSRLWPLLLVGLGVVKLAFPRRDDGRGGGAWLILIGLLLLGDSLRVLTFRQSWPLFLVAGGGSIVWNGLREREARRGD